MGRFIIEGGYPLNGTLRVQGAKNAALPILAAAIMSEGEITLTNCPQIRDVDNMLEILGELGAGVERQDDTVKLLPGKASRSVMPNRLSKELRSSIFMLGPLLSRFGRAVCTYPGGCEIGHRPVDLHLRGLAALGAEVSEERGRIICEGANLRGAEIHLDYPSVGATENIMMAAASARGDTCITNAAREPEIEDLQNFLNAIGCSVWGAGTSTLYIRGGIEHIPSAVYRIMPDRIAAGTILCGVAAAGGKVTLCDICCDHMGAALAKLREAGCLLDQGKDALTIEMNHRPREIKLIETYPYPGFPTDMQAQFFALCAVAEGTSVIVENLFENRFRHCAELAKMGAVITQKDRTAVVRGVKRLSGANVYARDLRCGAALTIAGLCADGITTVDNIELIDRGYQGLDDMLRTLGAHITREDG